MLRYTRDMTPFAMAKKPSKQYPFLLPLIWLAAFWDTRKLGLKIDRVGMKGIKPPYLVIATHQGPADYSAAPLAMFPHRAMYVSDMEGFAWYGKWLYRGLGCIGKRRFVSDIRVVRNMQYAIEKKQAVWVYPESRHSNVGTTAYIPKNLGKLCKMMDVPVVLFTLDGSYLANPFWDELRGRRVKARGQMELLFSQEEVREKDEAQLQKAIFEGLQYDEYDYQKSYGILIKEKFRAEGLHMPLYICRKCGTRHAMISHGDTLECSACKREYLLREDGLLQEKADSGETFRIPDWYEWERMLEIRECENDARRLRRQYEVKVEALPSEKGFVDMGTGVLAMDEKEFTLQVQTKVLHFPHRIRESVQTEYDYRGKKGKAIVLSTRDCCYYLYCDDKEFNPTQLQFLGEWLYQKQGGTFNLRVD